MLVSNASTWRALGLLAGLGVAGAAAPAMATPFTWNPNAAVSGADGQFTATNITVQDYGTVVVQSSGAFTENGIINLSSFSNNNTPVTLPGLDNQYTLYAQFSATGTQSVGNVTPAPGQTIGGTFDSLNYTLYAASGKPTFSATPGVTGLSNITQLATGSLVSTAANTSTLTNGASGLSAQAQVTTTLIPTLPAFFIDPNPQTFNLSLDIGFTNTGSVLTTPNANTLVINGGGGNATLNATGPTPPPVPEPASFALLGAGLLALTVARRQRLI